MSELPAVTRLRAKIRPAVETLSRRWQLYGCNQIVMEAWAVAGPLESHLIGPWLDEAFYALHAGRHPNVSIDDAVGL
jgi:hypothetical protein